MRYVHCDLDQRTMEYGLERRTICVSICTSGEERRFLMKQVYEIRSNMKIMKKLRPYCNDAYGTLISQWKLIIGPRKDR